MRKKTIIKVMIILYVVLMLVLPVGIYIMDYENAPSKWLIGINTVSQSVSISGETFALKAVAYNRHPLFVQQGKDGSNVEEFKLLAPTHNEIILADKENRTSTLVFSIIAPSENQAESIYFRSTFDVTDPQFVINNHPQELVGKTKYETNYRLNGEQQLYLELTYSKVPLSEKWSSFFGAAAVSSSRASKTAMPYVNRFFQAAWKVLAWIGVTVWKVVAWTATAVAKGATWLWNYAMAHRGQVWQLTKTVVSSVVHFVVSIAQFIYKVFSTILVWIYKLICVLARFVGALFQGTLRDASKLWHMSLQAWHSTLQRLHYIFVQGPKERRIEKISILMWTPDQAISVAQTVTFNFLVLDFEGKPAAYRAVRLSLQSKPRTNGIVLSPTIVTSDVNGRIDVRLHTGRDTAQYRLDLKYRGQSFFARINALPAKPSQIVSLKDQLSYTAPIGAMIKSAFKLKVYDRFQNPVPFARVDWYSVVEGVTESVKFFESRTDRRGFLNLDYRMNDRARNYWIQARLVGTQRRLNYQMHSVAIIPENMVPLGESERQIVVGEPLKQPFIVKVMDHYDNPVPNVLMTFTLQDDQQESVVEKQVRTNRKGLAMIRLNTPTRPGDYSLLVSSEKLPDFDIAYNISVQPGSVTTLTKVTGNAQTSFWGEMAPKHLRIRVTDSFGNPISGLSVLWKEDPEIAWDQAEPQTDENGYASARVGALRTKSSIIHPLVEVAGQQVRFDLYPKEPSNYSLHLVSPPVVKVVASQRLPSDIKFVLRDQYGHVLPGKTIELEYPVIHKKIAYQKNQIAVTNAQGHVTFNFVVSDQKDEINVKAKYFDGKSALLTWLKVDVIPGGLSRLVVLPEMTQTIIGQKLAQPIRLSLLDGNGVGMPGIPLEIMAVSAPVRERANMKTERQKTNPNGVVFFVPSVGKTAGDYVYQVKMMSFQTQFTVQVLSGRIENLTIRGPKQSSFVAGSVTNSYLVRALDQNGNPASGHSVLFGVGKATLKAKIGNSGFARLVVRMPHQAGDYQLMVSDETGRVKASSSVRVHETAVGGVRWLGDPAGLRVKAGATLRQAFPYQVVDKYGNALPKVSMSLDVYNSARSTSLVAIQGESKAKGAGQFSVSAPNKEGRYWVYISPTDWSDKGAWVTFDVTASDADTVQIVTGDNQTVRAGSHAPRDFMLMLSDQFGNPVIGQDVNWVYQVKKGSESRFLNKVSKTNVQGIAVFNVVMDREPGVRELKAYVTRHGRKYKQSFYYKIVSNEVGAIEIISGRDQIAHPGHPLPQPIRVRLVNRVGSPIGDAVVAFVIQPTTAKSQTLLQELSVHTNQLGIASAFLVSPSFPGKYHIKIAPAKNPQISGVALLTVL